MPKYIQASAQETGLHKRGMEQLADYETRFKPHEATFLSNLSRNTKGRDLGIFAADFQAAYGKAKDKAARAAILAGGSAADAIGDVGVMEQDAYSAGRAGVAQQVNAQRVANLHKGIGFLRGKGRDALVTDSSLGALNQQIAKQKAQERMDRQGDMLSLVGTLGGLATSAYMNKNMDSALAKAKLDLGNPASAAHTAPSHIAGYGQQGRVAAIKMNRAAPQQPFFQGMSLLGGTNVPYRNDAPFVLR